MKIEVNCTTGEVIEHELTAEDIERETADAAQAQAQAYLQAQREAEKERIAGALGITLDELKVLLS